MGAGIAGKGELLLRLTDEDTVFDQLHDCSAPDTALFQVFVRHLQPTDGIEDDALFELEGWAAGSFNGLGGGERVAL